MIVDITIISQLITVVGRSSHTCSFSVVITTPPCGLGTQQRMEFAVRCASCRASLPHWKHTQRPGIFFRLGWAYNMGVDNPLDISIYGVYVGKGTKNIGLSGKIS